MRSFQILFLLSVVLGAAYGGKNGNSGATTVTRDANAAFEKIAQAAGNGDFENARRGLIARPEGKILADDGKTVLRDFSAYDFVSGAAPETVNPALWRHATLNANTGLFRVTDRVYQLRGFDLANMTLIEGDTGWIVIDTLTARESARFALEFAKKHLKTRPISAIIFTHAHVDHFGGVLGVIARVDASRRKIPIIAPQGFIEEATSENVLVGIAMSRRATYQFGRGLAHDAKGLVDTGLGKDVVYGNVGILQPTITISKATETIEVDGLEFTFHNVPHSESPAELTFSVPELRIYDGAEILAQTMHNLLPVRGAKVRDALRWANYLEEALHRLDGIDVYIASHNWPIWGREKIARHITMQRDLYKFTHDQTVRLINAGLTPPEIAEQIILPPELSAYFAARGFYGDLRHNVKAVYQFYMGAYDGNPAHLNRLPPSQSAGKYVALIGGPKKVIAAAQEAFDKGEYRWAVELLNHVAFSEKNNKAAADLLARAYEQLAYQSESATWRNSYLVAAQEVRNGPPEKATSRALFYDLLLNTPMERFLEAMAANLNGPDAVGKKYTINLSLSDSGENFVLWVENAVLHFRRGSASDATASLQLTKDLFVKMASGAIGVKDAIFSDDLKTSGSKLDLVRFFGLIDKPNGNFPIVTR